MDESTYKLKTMNLGVPVEVQEFITREKLYVNLSPHVALSRRDLVLLAQAHGLNLRQAPPTDPLPTLQPAQSVVGAPPQGLPTTRVVIRKKKSSLSPLGWILLLLSFLMFIGIVWTTVASVQKGSLTVPFLNWGSLSCGQVTDSMELKFQEVSVTGQSNVVLYLPAKIPSLKNTDTCIYFHEEDMLRSLNQQATINIDGAPQVLTGRQILANYIKKQTVASLKQNDQAWAENVYGLAYSALDVNNFATLGEYKYLILPSVNIPAPPPPAPTATATLSVPTKTPFTPPTITSTPEPTSTPENTPTPLPTDTLPPTSLPRPTLEDYVTQVNNAGATAMALWDVTPLPESTTPPQPLTVTLDWYLINVVRGGAACSDYRHDYSSGLGMDNIVTMFLGPDCDQGHTYYVQIPPDLAQYFVPGYFKVVISKYPITSLNGPARDLGNGMFIQPFQP